MKQIVLSVFLLLPMSSAFAHFVWLERDDEVSARAYFGEWDRDLREKTGGGLDRIKSPKAWLGTSKKALKQERREDHIEIRAKGAGDVMLVEEGLSPRDDKKAGGKTKTVFHAKAGRTGIKPRLEFELVPVAPESNQFVLLFSGKPLAKTDVIVYGPPKWSKSFRTDESGRVTVETPWNGRYVIETEYVAEEPGAANGEQYDRLRHVFTISFLAPGGIPWSQAP
jgi:hypothetical protein